MVPESKSRRETGTPKEDRSPKMGDATESKPIILHFGDHCGPGIIICDILGKKETVLFQLGNFPFNGILDVLREGNFSELTAAKYLATEDWKPITKVESTLQRHAHVSVVRHLKYRDISFVHDFLLEDGAVKNHAFICKMFEEKVASFLNKIQDPAPKILINFTELPQRLRILEAVGFLRARVKGKFRLLIFSPPTAPQPQLSAELKESVTLVRLQRDYGGWWTKSETERTEIFRHIYSCFLAAVPEFAFPVWEETPYMKGLKK